MKKSFFKKFTILFPLKYKRHIFSRYCKIGENALSALVGKNEVGRIPGEYSLKEYQRLEQKYKTMPRKGMLPDKVVTNIIQDFMKGAPVWRSPNLQHNVGAAVNVVASALYALSLDVNIFNINSGLAGNVLAAERIVANILAYLAGVDSKKSHGIFTFGGTGTNLYALKIAINKSCPDAPIKGVHKDIRFFITEDAHSCHAISANWLGIGTDKLIVMPAREDRTSDLAEVEKQAIKVIKSGKILAGIAVNGGTTYDNAIDDIESFVKLRDSLIKRYSLSYKPHIHVDSVIGWSWLVFRDYDFESNPLKIDAKVLAKIRKQYKKIAKIYLADSWGVDFHKGVGGCPVPCSVIMVNNKKDFLYLSKKGGALTKTHHVAGEFSFDSPSDYTLETSRPGGAPLSALAAMYTLGYDGYRIYLSNLIGMVSYFRELIQKEKDMFVINLHSLGYVTMLVFLPSNLKHRNDFNSLVNDANIEEIKDINKYMKAFFKWDKETRMSQTFKNVYSYSSSYVVAKCGEKISALKFYPVSPHLKQAKVEEMFQVLKDQKYYFDSNVWQKRK